MKLTPSSTARRRVALACSRSGGSPQTPWPVIRMAPNPRRFTVRSPPTSMEPASAALGLLFMRYLPRLLRPAFQARSAGCTRAGAAGGPLSRNAGAGGAVRAGADGWTGADAAGPDPVRGAAGRAAAPSGDAGGGPNPGPASGRAPGPGAPPGVRTGAGPAASAAHRGATTPPARYPVRPAACRPAGPG